MNSKFTWSSRLLTRERCDFSRVSKARSAAVCDVRIRSVSASVSRRLRILKSINLFEKNRRFQLNFFFVSTVVHIDVRIHSKPIVIVRLVVVKRDFHLQHDEIVDRFQLDPTNE